VRKNTLDEMTVRRTEVPIGGTANTAGAPMRVSPSPLVGEGGRAPKPRDRLRGPRKPTLDNMGPGTDREVPVEKTRPHRPSLKETHGSDFIPLTEGERPRPRSIGGMPGSDAGKGKPRRRR
jgi:hypothetical protein